MMRSNGCVNKSCESIQSKKNQIKNKFYIKIIKAILWMIYFAFHLANAVWRQKTLELGPEQNQ